MTRSRINWSAQPLGEVSDHEIARRLKVTRPAVSRARIKRGIAAFAGPTAPVGVDWNAIPFGDYPDAVIARYLDVSDVTVSHERRKRGHPAIWRWVRPRLPADEVKRRRGDVQRRRRARKRRERAAEAEKIADRLAVFGVWGE